MECLHQNITVEPPCCNGFDSEGNISCGCLGQYSVTCNNSRCEGISESKQDELIENYFGGE